MVDKTLENEMFLSEEEWKDINGDNSTANKKSKDSVFVNLFEDKRNILQLYKELHPEDTNVTVNDISIQSLKAVLVNTIYNDLGFIVNENGIPKYVLLVEAQSFWNPNMTLRLLFYIAETYRKFLKKSKQSEHSNSRVKLPKADLYIVYSGDRKAPEEISFKDDYFNGDSPIDLKVKILSKPDTTIYGQYIGFCRVYNEQRKIYDNSLKCIEETIRICLDKGYLKEYLSKHKEEVFTMMSELFDEQAQRDDYNAARDKEVRAEGRAEGRIEGRAEGRAEGRLQEKISVALNLLSLGTITKEDIAKVTGLTIEKIQELAI